MTNKREMTIHYMDGSKMKLDFPQQAASEGAQVIKLKEALPPATSSSRRTVLS